MLSGYASMPAENKRGFTLIEVLASTILFMLLWGGVMGALLQTKVLAINSRHMVQATYVAEQLMEGYRHGPFVEGVFQTNVLIDPRDIADAADDLNGVGTVTVQFLGSSLWRVTAEVSWSEPNFLGPLNPTAFARSEQCSTLFMNGAAPGS